MSSTWSRKFPRLAAETVTAANETSSRVERASASPEPNPYLAGEVIGDRYRLVRELGRGGMGVVWVGYALALGVEVAVKLIRVSGAGPAVASRMAREAHAAARLGHPALVRVFDFGWTSRGDPYLVMELVQGETLSACLGREGKISAIRAAQMLLPLADGLRLAHDRTIVHRDIKPDNIFLASDPLGRVQPKLLDFGIAKVGPGGVDVRLTQVGVVLGSPEYMSPEQALGVDDIDERTDVWSLSVVLYEMVTGAMPFRKANYNALMQAIIHDPPSAMTDFAESDESLWRVVERGLAKAREDRWATMAELGEALALWLYEHGIKEDICGNSIRAVWLDGLSTGVKVETIPTVPPASAVARPIERRYSANANTMARHGPRHGLRLLLGVGSRQLVVAAGVAGVLTGGVIAALLLRGPSASVHAAQAGASASPATLLGSNGFANAGPARAGPSALSSAAAGAGPSVAKPVESLPQERTTNGVAATTRKGNPLLTGSVKSTQKVTKRRHDFGF